MSIRDKKQTTTENINKTLIHGVVTVHTSNIYYFNITKISWEVKTVWFNKYWWTWYEVVGGNPKMDSNGFDKYDKHVIIIPNKFYIWSMK